ncbi:hypothetical protein LSH36_578g01076 [Paralvinella palmiformis]|uniref:Uncharacterized protein n=1 Tax=Paralvinella palmiformis TaxID=53620 RepID=A0AAD9J5E0_9ANNE|nr:hypothetical protein LSH36_578g01076 [Paralvinella palmiformis]
MQMSTPDSFQSEAIIDLMKIYGWKRFAIIASVADYARTGLTILQNRAVKRGLTTTSVFYFHSSCDTPDESLKPILYEIKKKDVPAYVQGLIGTRQLSAQGELYHHFDQLWENKSVSDSDKVYAMYVFDSVLAIAYGVRDYLKDGHVINPPYFDENVCEESSIKRWSDGKLLMEYISRVSDDGVAHHINFTTLHYPIITNYEIVNLRKNGWNKEPPFTMKDNSDVGQSGLSKYKGYCIDLLNALQATLGFRYDLFLVPDGHYGLQDPETGHWNDLGNIILMPRDSAPRRSFFAFLSPFSNSLWLALGAACVLCAVVTTLVSWLSPYGTRRRWKPDQDPGRGEPNRNALSLWNSLWNAFSLWMVQGAEVTPRCLSGRLVYGAWYFTVMVVSATYTANLAAVLTVQRLDNGINNVEDLVSQKEITYAKRYAFILDSFLLEYAANQLPCHVKTVGRLFHQFGYGLGLQKNSPYLDLFSLEVLKLRQNGFLNTLYAKWVTSGVCDEDSQVSSTHYGTQQATLVQMTGVLTLMAGIMVLAMILILFECCVAARKDTKLRVGVKVC